MAGTTVSANQREAAMTGNEGVSIVKAGAKHFLGNRICAELSHTLFFLVLRASSQVPYPSESAFLSTTRSEAGPNAAIQAGH